MNRHERTLVFVLTLGLGLTLALLSLMSRAGPAHAEPDARYVAPGGVDSVNDCSDEANPCATVQHAVDVASAGDEVLVAAGNYVGVQGRPFPEGYFSPPAGGVITQVVYVDKALALRGGYDEGFEPAALTTTLDAEGAGRVILIAGDITVTLEGLHITGGDASGLSGGPGGADAGGGIYALNATVTLSACQVGASVADYGGGMALMYGQNATLTGNIIQDNTARDGGGGGVYFRGGAGLTLHGNAVFSNTSQYHGGGVYLQGVADATLSHNTFDGNQGQEGGGGLFSHQGDHVALAGNTFLGNTTQRGGGVFLYANTNATLDGNIVRDNVAQGWGGGLYLYYSDATLDNNVVVANQAGEVGSGIYAGASAVHLRHTTLARNHGGDGSGVYATSIGNDHSHVALTNTILVSHVVGINAVLGSSAVLNGVLWYGNDVDTGMGVVEVTNPTSGDPAFAADGYHITRASAALDAGVDAGLATDVDGDTRLLVAGPDLGADEIPRYLAPNRAGAALPGEQALYTHTLFNRASVTQTFVLSGASSRGWDVILSVAGDPGGTGTLGDSLRLPHALAPGERTTITATVQVPGDALSEVRDTTRITATGSLVGQDTASDATTVAFNDAAPTLGPDRSGSAASGEWAVYTHTLTNHANAWLTFDLLAVSSSGCAVSIVPTATESLPPFGGSAVITVALRAYGPQEGTLDTTVVTATAQGYAQLWATASDTTVMSPARIYLPLLVRQ